MIGCLVPPKGGPHHFFCLALTAGSDLMVSGGLLALGFFDYDGFNIL